ncbi:MAG TPA: GNAT family N-acetyltransferase [Alphaproteobacteria bacterium]
MMRNLASLQDLATARLDLRPLRLADAAALRDLSDDPAILSAIPFLSTPFTLSNAEDLIRRGENGRDCFLGGSTREPHCLVCVVGAHLRGAGEIEIGYWVGTQYQGKGYASEAGRAVVSALRREFPAMRIVAECRPENAASWRVLEKLGFGPTGRAGTREGRELLALDPG